MDETQQQIAELQFRIARLKHQIAEQEKSNAGLRAEIEAFARRYRRSVHHLYEKVEAVKAAIADFEASKRRRTLYGDAAPTSFSWDRPDRFAPHKRPAQNDSATPDEDLLEASAAHMQEIDLKQLYRQLARRFHPDLVTDEGERARRNRLMSIINNAYAAKDVATLIKIDHDDIPDGTAHKDDDAPDEHGTTPPLSPQERKLDELRRTLRDLEVHMDDLRAEHTDLMLDPLLDLKIEEKLARSRGRNLLKEIADDLNREFRTLSLKLESLRRGS